MGIYEDIGDRISDSEYGSAFLDWYTGNETIDSVRKSISSTFGSEEVKATEENIDEKVSGQQPEAEKTPQQPNATTTQSTQTVTKMVPVDKDLKPDERIKAVELALQAIVPKLNELDEESGISINPDSEIKLSGAVDGFVDNEFIASYSATMQHLNFLADLSENKSDIIASKALSMVGGSFDKSLIPPKVKDGNGRFVQANAPEIEKLLVKGLAESIESKHGELKSLGKPNDQNSSQIITLTAEIKSLEESKNNIPDLLRTIGELDKEGVLSKPIAMKKDQVVVVTQDVSTSSPTAQDAEEALAAANKIAVGNKSDIISKVSISDDIALVEGLLFAAGSKIKDFDKFGLSASIVTPLTKGEVGGEFGANSQDMLAKAIVLVKKLEGETNPNGEYSQAVGQQLKKAILTNPDLEMLRTELKIPLMDEATAKRYFGGAPLGSDAAAIAQHAVWKQNVEDQLHIKDLDGFIGSLDRLHAADQLDTENKAKSTTAANVVMDGMHMAMKKWAPGLMDMLQDFFNSDFGKMLAPILAMFGVNVNRLFGDKSDPDPETLVPLVGNGFDLFYEAAAEELGDGATHPDIMLKTKENIMGSMDGNIAFDAAMNLLFKDKGDAYIENIVENALDNALKEKTPEDARYAFSKSLLAAGQQYANGQDLDIAQINALLDQATKNMNDVDKELAAAVTKSLNQPAVATVTVEPEAEDDNSIAVNDKHQITLISTPDTTIYDQDPMRYAPDMVKAIQQGLDSAHDKLGLSTEPENMMKADGSLTEVFDMGTNKMLQELLLRAQVHDHLESNPTITQADLDGFERKITLDNMIFIENYMKAKGVSDADFQKISGNLRELGDDFKSIDPNNSNAGEPVKDSVLIQSLVPASLFDLKLEDLALKQEVKKAPTKKVIPSIGGYKATEVKAEEQKPKEAETVVTQYNRVAQAGLPPVSFKTLNKLTPEQNKYFRDEKLDLDKVFDDKIGIKEGSSTYYLLEPEKYGIMNSGVDMIVAMRDGYKVDIRGINYEQDKISPISLNGGARSVDSVLAFIDKPNGGSIRQGVASGVGGMYVLAPNSENNSRGIHLEKGTQYFFGNDARAYNAPQIRASGSQFKAFRHDSGASKSEPIVVAENKTYYPGQDTLKGWTGVGDRWIKTFNGVSGAIGGLFESDPKAAIEQNSSDMSTNDASGKFEAGDLPKFTGHDPFDDGNNAWSNSNTGSNGGI